MCYVYSQRAIEEGADFIETDILASKDGVLICFHDFTLDETTDVANHKEFANRKRTYEVERKNTTGFFPGKKIRKHLSKLVLYCFTSSLWLTISMIMLCS